MSEQTKSLLMNCFWHVRYAETRAVAKTNDTFVCGIISGLLSAGHISPPEGLRLAELAKAALDYSEGGR